VAVATESKAEERGLERLILFSDAVVAIAITLLVLPLTELKPEEGDSAWAFLVEHWDELLAFGISFLVIARFWFAHHGMFSDLVRMDRPLLYLNTGWLAAMVLLPFPTALLEDAQGYATLYLVNLLAVSILTSLLSRYIRRHPGLLDEPESAADAQHDRRFSLILNGGIGLALIASVFLQTQAMWLLLLIPIASRVVAVNGRRGATAG
jgi:uncharacterized membrane protein